MPLHLATIISVGIATNLDNVCIGLAYGLAGKRIRFSHNLLISLISGAFGFASCMAAGLVLDARMNAATIIGAALLIAMGLYTIVSAVKQGDKCEDQTLCSSSVRETALLGIALAINCLPVSFGVGLSGASPIWISASVMGFSFLSIAMGNILGIRTKRLFSARWLNVASGALLIAMGVLGALT